MVKQLRTEKDRNCLESSLAFVGATGDALLVAVGLLGLAWIATWWVPKHARPQTD